MNTFEKIKKTCRYYRSLSKKSSPKKMSDIKIRPDAYAFLTCPEPVLPSEKKE
ncbi:MAG: hypothetical protein KBS52_03660 [Clostridiales bacterium]|nr:hypothetical protein [Candidatus Equinaster intestinalis]